MTGIAKISTKGQVVIPYDLRKELGLDVGASVAIAKMDDFIVLRKINVPDMMKEFKQLTKWGSAYARKRGIRSEDDVVRMLHEGRGMKHA